MVKSAYRSLPDLMKNMKFYVFAVLFAVVAGTLMPSCKKGEDDPIISVVTRKDRFTNTWTMVKYEKNGVTQDISGATYTYSVFDNGTLTQTIEGSIFGFPTRQTKNGTWNFFNDEEDVKIIIEQDTVNYNLQRLAAKELWIRNTTDSDTFVYYFEGL